MPTRTAAQQPREPQRPPAEFRSTAWRVLCGAAAFALAEILLAVLVGRFFDWGRAEALVFHAFRPALMFLAVLAAASWPWRKRAALYGTALAAAAGAETLLLLKLGAADPWPEMLRGLAAGALLAAGADLLVQAARRWGGKWGRWAAALALLLLLVVPGALRPYEALLLTAPKGASGEKPKLMLMTGLPIVWGEAGPFDPASRPSYSYRLLQQEFQVDLLDTIEARTLGRGGLLLLAQPQRLEPVELAALDAWVRQGGRALILTDPALLWPSELPLGDIRRPPTIGLLGPLLAHWRLEVKEYGAGGVTEAVGARRLALQAPGRLRGSTGACEVGPRSWMATCRLGRGAAVVIADADLMHDAVWAPLGPERHRRTADNPLLVADWLDRLAGRERRRAEADVSWARPGADRSGALAFGLVPLLLMLGAALLLRRRRAG
ncbi:MAG TPA: hypothetical protein VGB59_06240 [Allosphingosinicella sp.]|jgi:hypothetical protein